MRGVAWMIARSQDFWTAQRRCYHAHCGPSLRGRLEDGASPRRKPHPFTSDLPKNDAVGACAFSSSTFPRLALPPGTPANSRGSESFFLLGGCSLGAALSHEISAG